ncbi:uncharacterized protein LOC144353223 [Saccoglossus kowalevskii]
MSRKWSHRKNCADHLIVSRTIKGWTYQNDNECLQLLYIQRNSQSQPMFTKNITIYRNLSWSVMIENKECNDNSLFANIAPTVANVDVVMQLVNIVNNSTVCIGNPDVKFQQLAVVRFGVFHSSRLTSIFMVTSYAGFH